MKKSILLNAPLTALIARMGHTETLTIADCGLPTGDTNRIDLALKFGIPGFLETLDTVLSEFNSESAILAEEIKTVSPVMHEKILKRLKGMKITYVTHEEFKKLAFASRGIVRTGECTPYANIIIGSGMTF